MKHIYPKIEINMRIIVIISIRNVTLRSKLFSTFPLVKYAPIFSSPDGNKEFWCIYSNKCEMENFDTKITFIVRRRHIVMVKLCIAKCAVKLNRLRDPNETYT